MIDTPTDDPIAYAVVFKCRICGVTFQRGLIEAEEGRAHLAYVDGSDDEPLPSTKVPNQAVHFCTSVLRGVADVVGLAAVAAPGKPEARGESATIGREASTPVGIPVGAAARSGS